MKHLAFSAVLVLMLSMGSTLLAQVNVINGTQKRVALVIGVSAYENAQELQNPRNDAADMSAALSRLGFDVLEVLDPTFNDLRSAELDFVDRLFDADVAVLYYAGHSIQLENANFLIPKDAQFSTTEAFKSQTFELARLANRMDRLAKTKILVLDACRDNPFLEKLQAAADNDGIDAQTGRGLASIGSIVDDTNLNIAEFNTHGTIVSYAAAPGRVALDGNGDNSPYTQALLKRIEEPGLEVGKLFRQVAADVIGTTNGAQKPEYLVKLTDDFYFKNPEPHECDYLAADPLNNVNVSGVEFDLIDTKAAIPACRAALEASPNHARYSHNLARALDTSGQYEASIPHYKVAADQGYIHAINNLGVMYLNGQGVKQDFVIGTALLSQARARGNLQSRVNLQGTDFSVLFKTDEFKQVQLKLAEHGVYSGKIDGDFGTKSKAALQKYSLQNGYVDNGLTLEVLDKLQLLEVIPNFSLN
ncbi:MAG: TPR repeat protein [Candidatus Azotimanducaceae bacterium]|jgi:TPR repeat protein